ncbi:MAG TPA: uroporphyrinogen-III synthase [Gammaproteobacteria bacterium]|nr:uroporphyrinogen-III synthase [Gammaproteobacteria bacterium]
MTKRRMNTDELPLNGAGVLVTRPAAQADALCRLIEQQGGEVYRFPVLEIRASDRPQALADAIERLDDYDWAFFVSANAVDMALTRILEQRNWPDALNIAVVGKRSATELERFGLTADLVPEHKFNSEALLAMPPMHEVEGLRCVIFRGNAGREYLADTLRERGAEVDYVEAYQRVRPSGDAEALLQHWRAGKIDIVQVNSEESLQNLIAMLGAAGQSLLRATPLLVVSERMLPRVRALGFEQPPLLAANATDQAVLDALLAWRTSQV